MRPAPPSLRSTGRVGSRAAQWKTDMFPISMTNPALTAAADGPNRNGIDLGGTKIEVAVLDPAGRFLLRERLPGQALTGPFGEIVANSFVPKVAQS